MTAIEWTDTVWNPTTGCDRVSPGCDHCYALTMAKRLKGMGSAKYQRDGDPRTSGPGFGITEHPSALDAPLRWRQPRKVFVNSMSDLFHDRVSDGFIAKAWARMAATPQHTYQVLTKRHGRMRSLLNSERFGDYVYEAWRALRVQEGRPAGWGLDLPSRLPLANVWLGVSVEDQKRADLRIPALLDTPAAVRFLSCEPLLGPVDLGRYAYGDEDRLHWVIVGGESGPGARPMHPDWARSLRDQCSLGDDAPAFFFKQWGNWVASAPPAPDREPDRYVNRETGEQDCEENALAVGGDWAGVYNVGKHVAGRALDGRTWDEYPAAAS